MPDVVLHPHRLTLTPGGTHLRFANRGFGGQHFQRQFDAEPEFMEVWVRF
jgi:hypothetical protein